VTALDHLDADRLRAVVHAYEEALAAHREPINRLNVYPVPDGDTGTNMSLTLMAVCEALDAAGDDLASVCKAISHGSLMGARGNSGALATFEATRPIVGAQAVGIARAAFEFARDYARERVQFGKPIAAQQAIAFKLADMATEIDAARLLVWRAAWMARNGMGFSHAEGSMSKLKAGEVATRVTDEAIQILGGYGFIRDFPVEKWHRDAKIYSLFEGTSEIQRLVISRANGGMA